MTVRPGRVGGALAALVAVLPWLPTARAADDTAWLAQAKVPADAVTRALNEVWLLSPEDAARRAENVRKQAEAAPAEGKLAGALVAAVALERADQPSGARAAY